MTAPMTAEDMRRVAAEAYLEAGMFFTQADAVQTPTNHRDPRHDHAISIRNHFTAMGREALDLGDKWRDYAKAEDAHTAAALGVSA